jgi:hypothetical protein
MIELDEDERDTEWGRLYERLCLTLAKFGTEDSVDGDFWVVDESNGLTQHKVYFNKLFMLEPKIVKTVQALLTEFSNWEIVVAVSVDEYEGEGWPEMGLIIRKHEVVDGLQRQYFPPEYQDIQYEGSRVGTDRD